MKVVVDTNVLVSGIFSAEGRPGKIVDWIISGELQACFNSSVLAEYERVLNRPQLALPGLLVTRILTRIAAAGELVSGGPLFRHLPDASDESFLEVARAPQVECLITGNLRHFPPSCRQGVRVLSPREFIEFYTDQPPGGSGKVKSPPAQYRVRRRGKKNRS